MIISLDVLSEDEVQHVFRRYPRAIYGLAFSYAAWDTYSSYLAQAEDLFITACGDGLTIGHPGGEPCFSADELADWLRSAVLPCDYFGDIYVAAPGASRAYLRDLRDAMGDSYPGQVYGRAGLARGELQPPLEAHWVGAA